MKHQVTKTYTHSLGLSCVFRQWRASSHCRLLHGYALQFAVTFEADELDENGWVVDFGSLKWLRVWLKQTFDHKLVVARDDPAVEHFEDLHELGLADVVTVPATGCEAFASLVLRKVEERLAMMKKARSSKREVRVVCVSCSEHGSNTATVFKE